MSREAEDLNRRLLRARDAMDLAYAEPLDVRTVARVAHVSPAHFIRCFRAVFGETPHRYLQRRRVERSMFLLRETDRSVTDVCFDVGFTSLGTFSRTFRDIVGASWHAWSDRYASEDPDHQIDMGIVQCDDPARGFEAGKRWSELAQRVAEINCTIDERIAASTGL